MKTRNQPTTNQPANEPDISETHEKEDTTNLETRLFYMCTEKNGWFPCSPKATRESEDKTLGKTTPPATKTTK